MRFTQGVCHRKGHIASLIGSGVEDQISEITIFKFLLHIPVAGYLNHSRKNKSAASTAPLPAKQDLELCQK